MVSHFCGVFGRCAAIWLSIWSLLRPRVKRSTWFLSSSFARVIMSSLRHWSTRRLFRLVWGFRSMASRRWLCFGLPKRSWIRSRMSFQVRRSLWLARVLELANVMASPGDVSEEGDKPSLSSLNPDCDDLEGGQPILDFGVGVDSCEDFHELCQCRSDEFWQKAALLEALLLHRLNRNRIVPWLVFVLCSAVPAIGW